MTISRKNQLEQLIFELSPCTENSAPSQTDSRDGASEELPAGELSALIKATAMPPITVITATQIAMLPP